MKIGQHRRTYTSGFRPSGCTPFPVCCRRVLLSWPTDTRVWRCGASESRLEGRRVKMRKQMMKKGKLLESFQPKEIMQR